MNFNQHIYNVNQFQINWDLYKYEIWNSNIQQISVYILLMELKVLKLKEGICNTRFIQELEYVW